MFPLGLVVYGGVCGPEMLNDMIIYHWLTFVKILIDLSKFKKIKIRRN